jgi:hypothetical protein
MKSKFVPIALACALALAGLPATAAIAAGPVAAAVAAPTSVHGSVVLKAKAYKNCTELNKVYKHGVAKKGAKDKVKGKSKPVTGFKVDTALYNANSKSDRDGDGVACEK